MDSITPLTNVSPSNRPTTPPEHSSDQACLPSVTKVNNNNPCRNTIIFEDNFNFIDDSKWSKLRQFSGEPVI